MHAARALLPFTLFYAALFAAFGVASPFFPGLLQQYGLGHAELGVVLAAGTAIRLVAGPLGGWLADHTGRPRRVLACLAASAAAVALLYQPAHGVALLLAVSVAHAAVLAPLTPIADALALGASQAGRSFAYGWVRGAGSAAFIAGILFAGEAVGQAGLGVIVWLNAAFLAVAACLAVGLPSRIPAERRSGDPPPTAASVGSLLRLRPFIVMTLVAALVGGSHALHDGFEVIRWHESGLSPRQSSALWAASVASEVVVFVFLGQPVLRWLGPAWAMSVSALAGVVRWSVAAQTAWIPAMALVEPLHGLTFALLHLACMETITRTVPKELAATAQAFYGTVAMGVASAAITLASGPLYTRFGAASFWFMAVLCALALPVAASLRIPPSGPAAPDGQATVHI